MVCFQLRFKLNRPQALRTQFIVRYTKISLITLHYLSCHLADAFIQSDLQLVRLSRRHTPLEQCGVKGLAQGPNSCADLNVATPGIKPPTLRVQVKYLNRYRLSLLVIESSPLLRILERSLCFRHCVTVRALGLDCFPPTHQVRNTDKYRSVVRAIASTAWSKAGLPGESVSLLIMNPILCPYSLSPASRSHSLGPHLSASIHLEMSLPRLFNYCVCFICFFRGPAGP